jgi:PAS domain S-box-containing protein
VGYEEEEMLQKDYRQVTHPDDVALSLACGEELWRGRKISLQTEKRYLRKDGRIIWGLVSLSMIRDDSGKPREVIAQVEDITERREALEQLQVQTTALKAAANGIVITDSCGNIQWVNDAFTRITGYSPEEVRRKNPRILKSGNHPVLDVDLAGENGMDLLSYCKAQDPELPVIIFTGLNFDGELVREARDRGAEGCMSKIQPLSELSAEVDKLID